MLKIVSISLLLALSAGLSASASELVTTYKDCANADGELSYMQPPAFDLSKSTAENTRRMDQYEATMKECEDLRRTLDCSPAAVNSRENKMYLVATADLKVDPDYYHDLAAAQLICSQRALRH